MIVVIIKTRLLATNNNRIQNGPFVYYYYYVYALHIVLHKYANGYIHADRRLNASFTCAF